MNLLLLRFYRPKPENSQFYAEFVDDSEDHIILAGFGRVGARIGAILSAAGVPYIAIERKQHRVKIAREQGFPVFYGDACNVKVLQAAGVNRATMIVVALDDPDSFDQMIPILRQYYPDMPIHARGKDRHHCADLIIQGASTAVSETLETSLRLTEQALLGSGVNEQDIKTVLNEFRDDYYDDVVQKVTENKVVMGELRH